MIGPTGPTWPTSPREPLGRPPERIAPRGRPVGLLPEDGRARRRAVTTRSGVAVAVVALVLVLAGVALARPDLVVVAAPLVLAAAMRARGWRPDPTPPRTEAVGQPEPGRHVTAVTLAAGERGAVRVRAVVPGYQEARALAVPGEVEVAIESARTGVLPPLRVDWAEVTPDGAQESEPGTVTAPALVVEPVAAPTAALPVPAHLVGLTGTHRSRRRGEGEDLHDIAPFAPGDRLRSVDWRVTARRGTTDPRLGTRLWVRRRYADAEAVAVVVLDSRDDVGPDVRTWAGGTAVLPTQATSLDVARQAAASYARAYVEAGDRVAFTDLAARGLPVPPGAGRRHLRRVVQAISTSAPLGEPAPLVRAPRVTSGALVVVVSTFLDDDAAAAARGWAQQGHPVVAVDVLPDLALHRLSPEELLAARVVLVQRDARLADLRGAGVELRRWLP